MDYLLVGKFINTHGIKGEIRLISNFERKDLVFKKGIKVYINNKEFTINSYRLHKNFDMLTFQEINDINDILIYKGSNVFVKRDSIPSNINLKSDLINYEIVYNNKIIGKLCDFFNNSKYDLIVIKNDKKEYLVPYLDNFIEKIDKNLKQIFIINMEGLIDENWYIIIIS